jgi:hypothetical protein
LARGGGVNCQNTLLRTTQLMPGLQKHSILGPPLSRHFYVVSLNFLPLPCPESRDSAIGIAAGYELDSRGGGKGFESR